MDTYVQAFLVALALSGVAFGIGRVVVFLGERSIETRLGAPGLRDRLIACAKLETALEKRREDRAAELKTARGRAEDAAGRRTRLDRQLNEALGAGETLIRVIGEEVRDAPCFHAEVVNKYVGAPNFEQKAHAYIDSSWAQPQIMEVWARSVAEARNEIERRYPPAFGYQIGRLLDINTVEAQAPKRKRRA